MVAFSLIKSLLWSPSLRKYAVFVVITAVGADQVIKYVDKKHEEAVKRLEAQALIVEKRLDRKDANDDERHTAVMKAVSDLQASFRVIDARTYDLWRAHRMEQVTRFNRGTRAAYFSQE